jgi:hypothetical protein
MNIKTSFSVTAVVAILIALAACGPAYVVPMNQGAYVQPVYEPGLSVVYLGGQQGYYDSYHVFRPMIIVGGYSGFYDSGHHFHSSDSGVRTAVQSNKPLYTGSSTGKPDFGSGGGSGRGTGVSSSVTVNQKPNFGSGGGSGRGTPQPMTTQKPNFGGGGGSSRGMSSSSFSGGSSRGSSSSSGSSGRGRR